MSRQELHFRTATMEDAPQIQQLVESAFQAEDSRPKWTADMALGRSFRLGIQHVITRITTAESEILLAFAQDNAQPIASVEVTKRTADMARLGMLAVDQQHQRGGLGRRVLHYAEEYCQRTWGVKKTGLNALSTREELMLWYERCGYRKTGEMTSFLRQRDDGMSPPIELYFVEMEKELI